MVPYAGFAAAGTSRHERCSDRMRWFNISYNDPVVRRAFEAICGRPFGFWQSIRRGGTGSYRFELWGGPQALLQQIDRPEDRRFCSLEVRSKGLVINLRDRLEHLAVPLAWSDVAQVELGSPGAGPRAPMRIAHANGEALLFGVGREHWGAMDRMLRAALPAGTYRTSSTSVLSV